jgi:solute carrier family 35, member E3
MVLSHPEFVKEKVYAHIFPCRIFNNDQLKNCQISYAMWHFTCTSIVLWLATRRPFKLFVPVRLPFLQMIPLCSFFAGFLILGNLSLAYNSIGFYQWVLMNDII